ncbi:hypothetical protein FRX31_021540 [Thalictrum thalictroides]|uniref:Reverse transcriptase zinc-binding domain n=1 Tax=Thalictrum thalictroides TaxID=46969 RepID=A0A7J6VUU8_THATH|nr:hypothetical protein FRX31_021540 [Thalictrum thalictroides]
MRKTTDGDGKADMEGNLVWQCFMRFSLYGDVEFPSDVVWKCEEENINHLFLNCSFAKKVWEAVMEGVTNRGSSNNENREIKEWLKGWQKTNSNRLRTAVWQLTPYAVLWTLWKIRNGIIFEDKRFSIDEGVLLVKSCIWYWLLGKEVRKGHQFSELIDNWVSVVTGVG